MPTIENNEDAIEATVEILTEEARNIVAEVLEDSRNNHAPKVWVGTRDYYLTMRDKVLSEDIFDKLDYQTYMRALLEDYLRRKTPDGIRLTEGPIQVPSKINRAAMAIKRENIEWMKFNKMNRGLGNEKEVWVQYFPEETRLAIQHMIDKKLQTRRSNTDIDGKLRKALVDFPEVFNRHTIGKDPSYRQFYADLNHELTHNFLGKTTEIKSEIHNYEGELNEGTAWFVGNYLEKQLSGNGNEGINFEHSPNDYSYYTKKGYDPERIYWVAELLRQYIEHHIEIYDMGMTGYPVDIARQTVNNYLTAQEGKYNGWKGFVLFMIPDDLENKVNRIREINRTELNTALKHLREEINEIEAEVKPTSKNKIKEDYQSLKTPEEIEEDLIEKIPKKVAADEAGFEELINLIEKYLIEQSKRLINLEEDLMESQVTQKNQKLKRRTKEVAKELDEVEAHLKILINDIEGAK